MNILLIVNYPADLEGVGKGRFCFLADMLSGRKHQVEMVISDFLHNEKKFNEKHTLNFTSFGAPTRRSTG